MLVSLLSGLGSTRGSVSYANLGQSSACIKLKPKLGFSRAYLGLKSKLEYLKALDLGSTFIWSSDVSLPFKIRIWTLLHETWMVKGT